MRNKNIIKPIGIKLFEDRDEKVSFILGNIILGMYILCMVVDSIIVLDGNLANCIYDIPINKIMFNEHFIKSIIYGVIILFFTISFYTFTNRSIGFKMCISVASLTLILVNISEIILDIIRANSIDIYFVKKIIVIVISIAITTYIFKSKKVDKIFFK